MSGTAEKPSADSQAPSQSTSDLVGLGPEQTPPYAPAGNVFAPGDPVPNRSTWRLVRELGRGGFGQVWLAKHEWKPDLAAVKFCVTPEARNRLVNHEKRVIVRVMKAAENHPNIVPLLDCDPNGTVPWLMYEYVGGERTLVDLIRAWGTLDPESRIVPVLSTLQQIACGLAHLHRLQPPIVHRDLKPGNVLMAGETPRLTDFGIGGAAVEADSHSLKLPTILKAAGTERYSSPEQRRGEPPSPQDDVYSLGVLAYHMLTARADGEMRGNWQTRLIREHVPDVFVELIGASTSEDRADRPADAQVWEHVLANHTAELQTGRRLIVGLPSVRVAARGVWYSRPPGAPRASWRQVTTTPADVSIAPNREYRFCLEPSASPEEIASLAALGTVTALRTLSLRDCENLTDEDVGCLTGSTALRVLRLAGCKQLTDGALPHLARLGSLEVLDLSLCELVSSAGLFHLLGCAALRELHLAMCEQITDAGLELLAGLRALHTLNLNQCKQITNRGIAHLAGLTELQALNLCGCFQITDAALASLKRLTALRQLELTGCGQLTFAAVAALQTALPGCQIDY